MKYVILALLTLNLTLKSVAGDEGGKLTKQEYINAWKKTAVNNMQKYRIPASIILAQGILESSCGNSVLATKANNHFGIKCHDWKGEKFIHDDDKKDECFRKYQSASESYADHAEFLKNRQRYAFLFLLDPKDYKAWAYGLKKAGYATNPQYPELLIKIIEDNQLYKYDEGNFEDVPAEPVIAQNKVVAEPLVKPRKQGKKQSKNEVTIFLEREIAISDNRIKYTIVKAGDSPQRIAEDLELGLWQILKYNDLDKTDRLKEGQIIYLQPKRKKAQIERHTLKQGETIQEISQLYGVKLSRIYKMNDLTENTRIETGTVIKLR